MPFIQSNAKYKPELLDTYDSFHLMHGYDRQRRVWRFIGYTCTKCDRTVKNPNIVPKHYLNCKATGPSVYMQEPEPEQIFDKNGNVWKPFDTHVHN